MDIESNSSEPRADEKPNLVSCTPCHYALDITILDTIQYIYIYTYYYSMYVCIHLFLSFSSIAMVPSPGYLESSSDEWTSLFKPLQAWDIPSTYEENSSSRYCVLAKRLKNKKQPKKQTPKKHKKNHKQQKQKQTEKHVFSSLFFFQICQTCALGSDFDNSLQKKQKNKKKQTRFSPFFFLQICQKCALDSKKNKKQNITSMFSLFFCICFFLGRFFCIYI